MYLNEIIQPPPDPQANRWIEVIAWQIKICGGNRCAAAILAYFFARHHYRMQQATEGQQDNQIAEAHGLAKRRAATSLWFRATDEQIENAIYFYRRRSFPDALKVLEDAGFIKILRQNPNPKFSFDKSRYFRLYPDAVQAKLCEVYGYSIRGGKSAASNAQNRRDARKIADNLTNDTTNNEDDELKNNSSSGGSKKGSKGRRKRSPDVPLPESFKVLTPELKEIAEGIISNPEQNPRGLRLIIAREHTKFINHADHTERLCKGERGWRAAWRNWIITAIERAERGQAGSQAAAQEANASVDEDEEFDDLERQLEEQKRRRAEQEGGK